MSLTEPLVLDPLLVDKPWGGQRLHALGRHGDADAAVGESWEVVDLPADATPVPDPVSRVVAGAEAGRSLHDLVREAQRDLLGTASPSADGRFPLLVKVLDAAETLSVQVHPPRSLSPTRTKTESWVVLDAEPGAQLLLGVRDDVTFDDVAAAAGTAQLVDLLARVPAQAGDVVHLPAGTIHALGAGVLVAEVQTPSDITHRLWDWPDERDGGRQLHVAEALASIEAGWEHNLDVGAAPAVDGTLVRTEAYSLARRTLARDEALEVDDGRAHVVLVLDGSLQWDDAAATATRTRAETLLLPAACTTPVTGGPVGATVLVATPA